MKRIKSNTTVAVVISGVALVLAIANIILCYVRNLEKSVSMIILICIALVFAYNLAYHISAKKKAKREAEREDDIDQ